MKGTPARGLKRNKGILHIRCRRCGHKTYHKIKSICAFCGYGKTARWRRFRWNKRENHRVKIKSMHYKLRR